MFGDRVYTLLALRSSLVAFENKESALWTSTPRVALVCKIVGSYADLPYSEVLATTAIKLSATFRKNKRGERNLQKSRSLTMPMGRRWGYSSLE